MPRKKPLVVKFRGEQPCGECGRAVGTSGYRLNDRLVCRECGERALSRSLRPRCEDRPQQVEMD
jgi:rubredoxin